MPPKLLVEIVLLVHFAYAGFVTLGFVAVLVGGPLRWAWVRRPVWRYLHAAAMAFVGVEAVIGMTCPLTELEWALRREAGMGGGGGSFIGRIANYLLYYDAPMWVFSVAYVALTVLVVALLWLVPVRRRGGARPATN